MFKRLILFAFVAFFVFFTLVAVVFFNLGEYLNQDEDIPKAKYTALLLMGNVLPRAKHAANLYHLGFIERLIMFRTEKSGEEGFGIRLNDADLSLAALLQLGVPEDIIKVVKWDAVKSTRDEAKAMRAWLRQARVERFILISSWYHLRRSVAIFRQVFGERVFYVSGAPNSEGNAHNWWWYERSFLQVFNEVLKTIYDRIKYLNYHNVF